MTDDPTCDRCGKPTHDQGYICTDCATWLRRRLELTARLAGEAVTTIARQSRTTGTGGGRPEPDPEPWERHAGALYPTPLPVALSAAADHNAVVNTLTTWARHIHTQSGRPLPTVHTGRCDHPTCHQRHRGLIHGPRCDWRPPDPRHGHPLAVVADWLAGQLDWLRHRPEAREAFDELADACSLAEAIVDRHADRWFAGLCECGTELYPTAGARTIRCPGCSATHDAEDRKAWLLDQADDVLGGAAWCAATLSLLGVPCRATAVRHWGNRGQLAAHGRDGGGRALYRLGDVRTLAHESIRRDLLRRHQAERRAAAEAADDTQEGDRREAA